MAHTLLRRAVALAGCAAALTLVGCGGGGGGGSSSTDLTGAVLNPAGQAVAGADVHVGGNHTTSLSNGTYILHDIRENYQLVQADITINGRHYSGETWADVTLGQSSTVNVMVSEASRQGGLTGRVIGPDGFGLPQAKVFVAGPIASTLTIADNDGNYQVDKVDPDFQYTVTASLAGYLNQTRGSVTVATGQWTNVSFALALSASQGPIPAPTGVTAQAWTIADRVSRADPVPTSAYEWLKRLYRRKRGLPEAPAMRGIERRGATRVTPSGSVIEVDLFWTYVEFNDLYGYAIKRGTNSAGSLPLIATMRDPLARGFFDVDSALTPDVVYYYTVHRLDTIDFPQSGSIGPASSEVSAQPMEPLRVLSPSQGAHVGEAAVFQWTSVSGATTYQIYVFDRFPDLTDPSDPNSAQLVWPVDPKNPGSSLVQAPSTSQAYAGPALQPGHTYYWMVVASDNGEFALSASPIMKFVD